MKALSPTNTSLELELIENNGEIEMLEKEKEALEEKVRILLEILELKEDSSVQELEQSPPQLSPQSSAQSSEKPSVQTSPEHEEVKSKEKVKSECISLFVKYQRGATPTKVQHNNDSVDIRRVMNFYTTLWNTQITQQPY